MKKIKRMAKYAYRTVPLYANIAEKNNIEVEQLEFEQLPIMDKSHYLDCGMSVLSSEYIGKYLQRKLIWGRTSGSTGKFGEVYWDEIEMRKSLFSLWCYRRRYYNILASDRLCYFMTADMGETDSCETDNSMAFSRKCLYDGTLKESYLKIVEFNPVWMILQPSIAVMLCNIIQEYNLEIPPALRYIEFTGEYLEDGVRQKAKDVFRCTVANQYGAKEVNSIAFECPEGNLHCLSDNVFTEIVKKEGEYGDICVTTMKNRAMPLVRFNIGDRGKIVSGRKCACGNCNNILVLEKGRNNDWIKLEDGSRIHAYAVMQVIHLINYETDGGILQYQIIQNHYKKFTVKLVLDEPDCATGIIGLIMERMSQRLGNDAEITVNIFSELLPAERTGKLASFISEV